MDGLSKGLGDRGATEVTAKQLKFAAGTVAKLGEKIQERLTARGKRGGEYLGKRSFAAWAA